MRYVETYVEHFFGALCRDTILVRCKVEHLSKIWQAPMQVGKFRKRSAVFSVINLN